jgi:glycosyltransferase involved in cell wall biosynthesis
MMLLHMFQYAWLASSMQWLRKIYWVLFALLLVAAGYYIIAPVIRVHAAALPGAVVPNNAPVVLLVSVGLSGGGLERSVLAQHEAFCAAGIRSILVVQEGAFIVPLARAKGLPMVLFGGFAMSLGDQVFFPALTAALKKLLHAYGEAMVAIHCNSAREVFVAKRVVGKRSIPIIFTQHTLSPLRKSVRAMADGLVGVSPRVVDGLQKCNQQEGIQTPVVAVPPFFDTARFLNFITKESREAYFQQVFGLVLKPCPVLVKVAHFYADVACKNHPVLFHAMHELIYKKGTPVQVVLAGTGATMLAKYKKLVHALGLDGYVHFVGQTEETPALFYHADIALLAGEKEAFGLVLAEGGMLKKPTIIADRAGAAGWLIEDNVTGFLFQTNNPGSLADKIAYVLAHPALAAMCGERLFHRVSGYFSAGHGVQKLLTFYQSCAKTH